MPDLLLPVLAPFVAALACLLVWRNERAQAWITVGGMFLSLLLALRLLAVVHMDGIQVVQAGGWIAPFGISLVADQLSAIMLVVSTLLGLAVAFYSIPAVDVHRESFGYYPFFNFLLFGVGGAFVAGDIFNLYVWFEIMLISSFVLLALGGEKRQLEGAIIYVTLNFFSSAIFLAGVAMLYSLTGTLNFADLAVKLKDVSDVGMVSVVALFFLVSFGIKAAIFPLFFWLPASYHTPPIAVAAIFSGLLTKVGVYALMRVFTLIFVLDIRFTHDLLLVIAALTMVVGVLGAASHYDFRRILSFHIVSQIGYMIMGLALYTPLALMGTVFYLMHHMIVKTNLFLISGVVHYLKGSYKLKYIGGVYRDHPWLAFLFLVPALSLAGLPPFSGFWAKFILIKAAIDEGAFWLVGVALGVSLLTLYSMTKIWNEVFWANEPEILNDPEPHVRGPGPLWMLVAPVVLLVICTLAIGLHPAPLLHLAEAAANQLLDREQMINAVLQAAR
jgi:multicomponent Na+:H+ antiporter subunit D